MSEMVKTDNQVRVYLDAKKNKLDHMVDVSFRNGIWSISAYRDGEGNMALISDTKLMREFFEAGLEIIRKAEADDLSE